MCLEYAARITTDAYPLLTLKQFKEFRWRKKPHKYSALTINRSAKIKERFTGFAEYARIMSTRDEDFGYHSWIYPQNLSPNGFYVATLLHKGTLLRTDLMAITSITFKPISISGYKYKWDQMVLIPTEGYNVEVESIRKASISIGNSITQCNIVPLGDAASLYIYGTEGMYVIENAFHLISLQDGISYWRNYLRNKGLTNWR